MTETSSKGGLSLRSALQNDEAQAQTSMALDDAASDPDAGSSLKAGSAVIKKPTKELSDYEKCREENIKEKLKLLKSLNIEEDKAELDRMKKNGVLSRPKGKVVRISKVSPPVLRKRAATSCLPEGGQDLGHSNGVQQLQSSPDHIDLAPDTSRFV